MAKDAGKALAPVDPVARGELEAPVSVLVDLVAPEVLAVLADQVDQAQNVLVGLISKKASELSETFTVKTFTVKHLRSEVFNDSDRMDTHGFQGTASIFESVIGAEF